MRSADAAASWAEAQATFSPINNCLRAVLVAYDVLGQIAALARADATATEVWDLAHTRHAGDRNPPRGALVCFPNWGAGKSGHIAIGTGDDDEVRSTGIDSSEYFTGTIAQVAQACGNAYAGWVGDFDGRAIDFTSTAGGNVRPFPETPTDKEDTMSTEMLWFVTKASTDKAKTAVQNSVWYQRSPGDALVKLDDDYTKSSEYTQLVRKNYRNPDGSPITSSSSQAQKDAGQSLLYTPVAGDSIVALIGKYGQVASYANAAPAGGAFPDPAAWGKAAAAAFSAALPKLSGEFK